MLRKKKSESEMDGVMRGLEEALASHPILEEAKDLVLAFRLYVAQDIIPLKSKAKRDYLRRIDRLIDRIYSLGEF